MRGHDETDQSANKLNFLELCKLFGKYDDAFKSKLNSNFNFISYKIQNELLVICADLTKKAIIEDVQCAGFYSKILDEVKCHK